MGIRERVLDGDGFIHKDKICDLFMLLSRGVKLLDTIADEQEEEDTNIGTLENDVKDVAQQIYIGLTGDLSVLRDKPEKQPKYKSKKPETTKYSKDGCLYVVMYWNGDKWKVEEAHSNMKVAISLLHVTMETHEKVVLLRCKIFGQVTDVECEEDEE